MEAGTPEMNGAIERQEGLARSLLNADGSGNARLEDELRRSPATTRFGTPDDLRKYVSELSCISNVQITFKEALGHFDGRLERDDSPPSVLFKTIDATLAGLFISRLRSVLPDDSRIAPHLQDIFERTVWKGIDDRSTAQAVLLRKFIEMAQIRGKLVREYVEKNPHAAEQLNPAAMIEYRHFGDIADAVNEFYILWREDCGSILSTDERKARGFANEFAAIRYDDEGQPVEMPWHEAYSEQIVLIVQLYQNLADELSKKAQEETEPRARALLEKKTQYYLAVAKAYSTSNIDDWRVADTLLPQQTNGENEPVHIHTIESGYGKDRIQRGPEASLRAPDVEHREINDRAMETRTTMSVMTRRLLEGTKNSDEQKQTAKLLDRSLFTARHFMGAGEEIMLLPAGQILPNEIASRLKGGLDISANPDGMANRLPLMREAFREIFESDFPELPLDELLGGEIASHEFGHSIGITATTEERLGASFFTPYVEEWKASAGGMIFNLLHPYLVNLNSGGGESSTPEVSPELLRKSVYFHIANGLRYITMRGEAAFSAYVRKSYMLLKIMEDVGILVKEGGQWCINDGAAYIIAFFQKVQEQYEEVLKIYDTGTADGLRSFLEQNLRPTEFLEDATAKLDTHFNNPGLPSVSELCKTPHEVV